jgi:hypothetical protein
MSNNKQQTALEILFDRIKLKADSIPINNQANRLIKGAYVDCLMLIREAKEMEKEQIKDAYWNGSDGIRTKTAILREAEEFYNETYGGNK